MLFNKHESAESLRGQTFKSYMEDDSIKAIYSGYLPFKRGYNSFLSHFAQFNIEAANKTRNSSGTVTKHEQKKSIAKRLGKDLKLTKDYSIQSKNSAMKIMVSFSERDINKMKDSDILPFVTNLKEKVFTDALFMNVDFLTYEVTSIGFNSIVTDATDFNKETGEVKEEDNSSTTANDKLGDIIDLIHLDFESMDNTIARFIDDQPDFVNGFNRNKALVLLGTRHEGVTGFVRMHGVLQPKSLINIEGKNKHTVADNNGKYRMYLIPGDHTIIAKNATGNKQTKTIHVEHRKMLDVDFELE